MVRPAQLADLLRSAVPLKARLMDQTRVAGIGNLLVDEMLWRAGLDPARPAASLQPNEVRRLHRHLRRTVENLIERGGSHTGDLQVARERGGVCPKDGAPLLRRTVGGRTTYSCPRHQR
jgi:formamidopyrimidine-DNA glycosylase